MGLSDKQNEALKMIITSGELLCTVVNDILDYSKLESGNVAVEIRRTNLQDTLDSVVNAFEHKARSKNLAFCLCYSPLVPEFVDTDGNRLQQILFNLLGNALKFSDEGGTVELLVDVVDRARSSAVLSTTVAPAGLLYEKTHPGERNMLRFTVKDYGRGIAKKDFERIFEPFLQASDETERVYGGTGLGLAITSNLVERLGGSIEVESELGKWSKFTVDFPGAVTAANSAIDDLLCRLGDTRVFYVGKPTDHCSRKVVDSLRVRAECFVSFTDMYDAFAKDSKPDDGEHTMLSVSGG
jgi:signal transduction histidine kinase